MTVWDEYDAELLNNGKLLVESGQWDVIMNDMKIKSESEMSRMVANGAIDYSHEDEDEDDCDEE